MPPKNPRIHLTKDDCKALVDAGMNDMTVYLWFKKKVDRGNRRGSALKRSLGGISRTAIRRESACYRPFGFLPSPPNVLCRPQGATAQYHLPLGILLLSSMRCAIYV